MVGLDPRGARLIKEDGPRPVKKSGAEDQPLLHAVGEALDELTLPRAELEEVQHLHEAPLHGLRLEAVEAGVEAQELAGGELLVEEGPVGDESESPLCRLRLPGQVLPVHDDPAAGPP